MLKGHEDALKFVGLGSPIFGGKEVGVCFFFVSKGVVFLQVRLVVNDFSSPGVGNEPVLGIPEYRKPWMVYLGVIPFLIPC